MFWKQKHRIALTKIKFDSPKKLEKNSRMSTTPRPLTFRTVATIDSS